MPVPKADEVIAPTASLITRESRLANVPCHAEDSVSIFEQLSYTCSPPLVPGTALQFSLHSKILLLTVGNLAKMHFFFLLCFLHPTRKGIPWQ